MYELWSETYFAFCPSSGNDQLLPSQQEGERLLKLLPKSKCQLRKFDDSGHFLFLVYISRFLLFCMHVSPVFAFRHASRSFSSDRRKKISNVSWKFKPTLIWCLCPLLTGRQHWPGNNHQRHFILPPWQVSWLCIRFYTSNTWWGQKHNRIKQVKITGWIWSYEPSIKNNKILHSIYYKDSRLQGELSLLLTRMSCLISWCFNDYIYLAIFLCLFLINRL